MLNQHSRLNVPFESGFIPEFDERLDEFGDLSKHENMRALLEAICTHPFVVKGRLVTDALAILDRHPRTYSELINAIFSELANRHGKVRWADKTPSYVLEMEKIWRLFPGCRFIHLVRDGRDVASSLATLSWGSRDLVKVARDWSWKVTLGRKMGRMIPSHYLEVRYEDLVSDSAQTLTRICGFIGESFEPTMLQYHETAEREMPSESIRWHGSSVSAPDQTKAQAWRRNMGIADQIVFDQIAGDTLDLFGYGRSLHKPTIGSRIKYARYAILGRA